MALHDRVSITYGNSPRKYVWTFTAAVDQSKCPCSITGDTSFVPSFVGEHYYYESGSNNATTAIVLHVSDPIWDGEQCDYNKAPMVLYY